MIAAAFAVQTAVLSAAVGAKPASRPNVLLIMADDMGYSDLGCYGSSIETPNLDHLAANGLRFTRFYNEGRCWPTRAALMTGRNAHDVGHAMARGPNAPPAYQGTSRERAPMIAELIGEAGYRSYHVGKWHLASDSQIPQPIAKSKATWAINRGFERSYSVKAQGFLSFFNPGELRIEGEIVRNIGNREPDYYYTDALTERTLAYLTEHEKSHPESPFFLYLAHIAPHYPLHAKPEDIEKYRGKFRHGWDEMRKRRHARMQELVIYDGELSPRDPAAKAWHSLSEADQIMWDERMAIHAAMIDCMDQGIGRILAWLEQTGRLRNTLILFLSDNGASRETGGRKKAENHKPGAVAGSRDSFLAIETAWSNACNTPFRLHKAFNHEGGIATPLIVHWPAGIASEHRGSISRQVGRVNDVLPTVLGLAGVDIPAEVTGQSLTPCFEDPASIRERTLYWEHLGRRAVRRGDWKLVADNGKRWELYDLSSDPAEMRDLSRTKRGLAQELDELWKTWAMKVGVTPRKRNRPK